MGGSSSIGWAGLPAVGVISTSSAQIRRRQKGSIRFVHVPSLRMAHSSGRRLLLTATRATGHPLPAMCRLKAAADLLDDASLAGFPTVRPGETERDVHSRLVESGRRRGAQWAHGILNARRNTVAYGGEGETVFQAGDIRRKDDVSYSHG
jgi:hypothetical protein